MSINLGIQADTYGDLECCRRGNFLVKGGNASKLSLRGNFFLFVLGSVRLSLYLRNPTCSISFLCTFGCLYECRFWLTSWFGGMYSKFLSKLLFSAEDIDLRPTIFWLAFVFVISICDEYVWGVSVRFCSGILCPRNFNLALRSRLDLIFVSWKIKTWFEYR